MPISISALAANRRTVKVPVGDEFLTVVYRPSAVNAVQEARELEERSAGRHVQSMANSLAEIIHSWDLVDDTGKAAPITSELLSTFGLDVLQTLTREIIGDLLPNRTTASNSNGTSSQTAGSGPSPSGT